MSGRRNRGDSSDEESSDDEDLQQQQPLAAAAAGRTNAPTLDQLKREKRLAMNRESARARRRRKKIRLETLEQQAEDLSQKHHSLVMTNESLKSRVVNLENELATAGGSGRAAAAVGLGGSMDASSILGGGGLGRAAGGLGQGAAGLGGTSFAADHRQAAAAAAGLGGSFADQRASLAAMAGLGAGSAAGLGSSAAGLGGSSTFAGMGMGGMMPSSDPEMQYLQMQQRLLSSQTGATTDGSAGSGASAAARLIALEEMQRRNQLAAARGGIGSGGGQISDMDLLNQQRLPGLRDVSRLRAAEGLRGPSMLDLAGALTPADAAAARLVREANDQQMGGSGRLRDPKTELYERLTDTNKKLPPRGSG